VLRAVLDPGVLISAVLSRRGAPRELIVELRRQAFELVLSAQLLVELELVLARPKFSIVSVQDRTAFVNLVRALGRTEADPAPRPGISADPDDDYLVALAQAAGATHLVTGDRALLTDTFEGVVTISPRDFLELLRSASTEDDPGR
jgi:putative PIN family toxin of toxin-antitoxin system